MRKKPEYALLVSLRAGEGDLNFATPTSGGICFYVKEHHATGDPFTILRNSTAGLALICCARIAAGSVAAACC